MVAQDRVHEAAQRLVDSQAVGMMTHDEVDEAFDAEEFALLVAGPEDTAARSTTSRRG